MDAKFNLSVVFQVILNEIERKNYARRLQYGNILLHNFEDMNAKDIDHECSL